MKMLKIFALVSALIFAAMPAQARQAIGVHEKIADSFMYLVDNSGSMLMEHKATGVQKIEMAKQIMTKINSNIPDLGYQGAITLFTPNKEILAPMPFAPSVFNENVNAISNEGKIFARLTSMSKAFPEIAGNISQLEGQKAIYLISDGISNYGHSPAEAARILYSNNSDMILHVISVADTVEGKNNLMDIAAENDNAVYVNGVDLLYGDNAAEKLVSETLYVKTIPSQTVASMQDVLFQVGKYDILPKYAKLLDHMGAVMATRPDLKIFIEGYADPSGNVNSNLTLSEKRAHAVKDYLIGAGVRENQVLSLGRGETDVYPSYQLDRRVEVMIIWE